MNVQASPRSAAVKTGESEPITISARHPKSGLAVSYRVVVETVDRTEVVDGTGVTVGLAARLTVQAGPWQRPVIIMASRLSGEGAWYSDAKVERGGRVLYSRGFGNRSAPHRLLADIGDVLSIYAYGIPGLVEEAEPGRPLRLGKA